MAEGMLEGKIALITGASSGIGRGAAVIFAGYGARLALADIDVEGGEETAREVRKAGGEAIFIKTDVAHAAEVEALVKQTVAYYGRLDCAFNNAGIDGVMGRTAEYTEENWDQVIGVNLRGVWLCMKYEIPQMLSQGGGSIVNTSSGAGLTGVVGLPAYVASKHGVIGLTRAAALEYAKESIRINVICPGAIRTPMIEQIISQGLATERGLAAPLGRLGIAEEVGEAAAWLLSPRASFMNGHAMSVDGGTSAG
jgi:NAD(P)-dependent dehydrogenase (short-subunit alcohol dehydrogenase family)